MVATAGCTSPLDEIDGIFYDGGERRVHCAANLDDDAGFSLDSVYAAFDRAAARAEIVELYTHSPGVSVSNERLTAVIEAAATRGLRFVTYSELADGARGPGIALSFDDHATAEWVSIRPLLDAHDAHVTFFVSAYFAIKDLGREQLRELAADGHELAAHTVHHRNAPEYVEEYGLGTYMSEELVPSIDVLEQDGQVVTSFAYPFGARTSELDNAILEHVRIVRAVASPYSNSAQGSCPL